MIFCRYINATPLAASKSLTNRKTYFRPRTFQVVLTLLNWYQRIDSTEREIYTKYYTVTMQALGNKQHCLI